MAYTMKTFKFINKKNNKITFINGENCSAINNYYKVFIKGEEIGSFYKDTYELEILPYDKNLDTVDYFDHEPPNLEHDPYFIK
jgi:hypothetical protein